MKLKIRDIKFQKKTSKFLEHIQKVVDSFSVALTVRQIHYRLVALGIVDNTIQNYRKVSRITSDGRYAGLIDWDKIVDDTRNAYKTQDWDNIDDAIKNTLDNYRRNRWKKSKYYVEVAVEKRTLTNMFYPITNKHDVYLNVGGGWNSTSNIKKTVYRLWLRSDNGKKKIAILYFGDLDPSGDDMTRDIEHRLKEFGLDIEVKRILINMDDVERYSLVKRF